MASDAKIYDGVKANNVTSSTISIAVVSSEVALKGFLEMECFVI
jgi:hypothetical protein